MSRVQRALGEIYRSEYGRCVASMVRFLGDIDLAEEAVQEAFAVAAEKWPDTGLPPNPGGWVMTTARNRAIDRLRRDAARGGKHAEAAMIYPYEPAGEPAGPQAVVPHDDRLRLLFTCCHPALSQPAQVALTLRLLCGLATPEIARAFLVPEPTMGQRISRAKAKIKAARIPYRVPEEHELPDRLPPVLAAIYLTFNEGYSATAGEDLVRADLCEEAIRLARLVVDLMPDEPEVKGLLALLLLTHARRSARVGPDGSIVLLADQDRGLWDGEQIAQGHALVRECLRRNAPGPYQVQAAIAAVHTDAADAEQTQWPQILALYDQLLALTPTPVVALNRAVAVAHVQGPAQALGIVEELASGGDGLDSYHLLHATRAVLLDRLGRADEARRANERARDLAGTAAERRLLDGRLASPSPR